MITAMLQARMGSKRLPGKVAKIMGGKPMMAYTIESLLRAPLVTEIFVLTTYNEEDDVVVTIAKRYGCKYYRGILESNVLSRFLEAARLTKNNYILRATGDNPITDFNNPERLLRHIQRTNDDYSFEEGLPLGCGFELFTQFALGKLEAYDEECFTTPEDNEHVTTFMKENFRCVFSEAPKPVRAPEFLWTVDTQEDFDRVKPIVEKYYSFAIIDLSYIIADIRSQNA